MFMETFNMKLTTIQTGNFKLDGGAMFGVVPKVLWNRLNPADENNLCNWAMRCLLVEINDKKILIDTGIGNKQSENFYSHYYLNGNDSLTSSLACIGIDASQITDVLLTHLHFDHCGGAVIKNNEELMPAFPNATYYVSQTQWDHANNPNPREKASFLKENFVPLMDHGVLKFLQEGDVLHDCMEVHLFNGHTLGMIAPLIHLPDGKKMLYGADLFPSSNHLKPNFAMGYDIQPLLTMTERESMNQLAVHNNWYYFYEHDLNIEVSQIGLTEKGQYEAINKGMLSESLKY